MGRRFQVARLLKKPIAGRFFGGLLLGLGSLAPGPVQAQEGLTIDRALRLAEDYRPLREELVAQVDLAGARARRAGLWPNPSLAVSRERFEAGSATTTQWFYRVTQELDLSGQRGLRTEAARARAEAVRRGNAWTRVGHRTTVRRRFYAVLFQQSRKAALRAGLRRLDQVATIVAERRRAGAASGYDQRRVERERAGLKARLREAEGEAQRAWAQLGFLLSEGGAPKKVAGSLSPGPLPPLRRHLERVVQRGDLRRLQAKARSASLEQRAAARAWVPDPTIGLGYTRVNLPGADGGGILARISIPLPAFARGQADVAAASARQARTEARYRQRLEKARAKTRGLWHKTRSLRESTAQFREQALARSRELTDIAESAYRADEQGILELLDAYRSQLKARLRALAMAHATRTAYIQLIRVTGGIRP